VGRKRSGTALPGDGAADLQQQHLQAGKHRHGGTAAPQRAMPAGTCWRLNTSEIAAAVTARARTAQEAAPRSSCSDNDREVSSAASTNPSMVAANIQPQPAGTTPWASAKLRKA
jgi:hypothetical protein